MSFSMDDYVDVSERLRQWYEKWPEGRVLTEIVDFTPERVTVKATAYCSHGTHDLPAGTGHSSMTLPGSTPFTKGSELENAETSAIGRALVAAGLPKRVASTDEVKAKKPPPGKGQPAGDTGASGVGRASGSPTPPPTETSDGGGDLGKVAPSSDDPREQIILTVAEVFAGHPKIAQAKMKALLANEGVRLVKELTDEQAFNVLVELEKVRNAA